MIEESAHEPKLSTLATEAVNSITSSLLEHFQKPGDDKSYRRAMFRQNSNEYGCSLVIDVLLEDNGKKAHIITKFGKSS